MKGRGVEPFVELAEWPTVVHVRTNTFSDTAAPFIRQTVLGLRPYFNNVVVARATDCENPSDLKVITVERSLRDAKARAQLIHHLRGKFRRIAAVMGHMGNGTREGMLLAEGLDVPLLGSFGGSDVNVEFAEGRHDGTYRKVLLEPTAQFVTVADYLRDRLLAKGAPAARTFAWHRGVDLDRFAVPDRGPRPDGTLRIVMCARFYEVKGHVYALRAFARVRARFPNAELVLLGDGPLMDEMKELVQTERIGGVHFYGQVSHQTVQEQLRDADIYLHPSISCSEGRTEGVPNAIMEAHATGLPVVATLHGGIPEVVRDQETGFLVPERNADALAERLIQLVGDGELRARMGRRGREWIEKEFNLRVQSRRLAARLLQTAQVADLYRTRGWSLYYRQTDGEAGVPTIHKAIEQAGDDLADRLLNPNFVPKHRYVAPLLKIYKQTVWTTVMKPYIKFIGRASYSSFMNVIEQLASSNGAKLAPYPDSGRAPPQLMSSGLCLDCPHAPAGKPWPDVACPFDSGCFDALQREFETDDGASTASEPVDGAVVLVGDADLRDGRLELRDDSCEAILFQGDLQTVADLPSFFQELHRALKPQGRLELQVSPLPGGQHAGSLLGGVHVPFATRFFSEEVLRTRSERDPSELRWFDSEDLRRAAIEVGFLADGELETSETDTPCETYLQARFAAKFRNSGCTRDQLASRFSGTFIAR